MQKSLKPYRFVKNLPNALREIRVRLDSLEAAIRNLEKSNQDMPKKLVEMKQKQADIFNLLMQQATPQPIRTTKSDVSLQADNHILDSYYMAFENKFRGSEDEIYLRLQKAYSAILKALPVKLKKLPVIDVGCGRGEFLKLYQELGFKPIGIDLNVTMVERCRTLGFEAHSVDAIEYLAAQPAKSIAGVSGVHLVEHITFPDLINLFNVAFRALTPGGFILFETPNPENLSVGAHTFWHDSSHLKPIPPAALAFLAEYVGFGQVEIIRLHPEIESRASKDKVKTQTINKLFGPRDYAVIAYKK